MRFLITRPEPDADALKAQLEALGHETLVEPLLRIEPLPIEAGALDGAQAILVTSRNGLRALERSRAWPAARRLPVFVVGPGTADLARAMDFASVIPGAGTARDLVPLITAKADPAQGPLVYLAGEAIACDLAAALAPSGFTVRTVSAYRAKAAVALTSQTARRIAEGSLDAVILMSPRTAAIFAQLVGSAGLRESARRLVYVCLSPNVAAELRGLALAPTHVEVADEPNAAAVIAAAAQVASRSTRV